MLPRDGSARLHVFSEEIILMRGVRGLIAIIGAAFGELFYIAFPDLFKHVIYGRVADFLDRIVTSEWATMIAYIIQHAMIVAGGILLAASAYWLGVARRHEVVQSGVMPTDSAKPPLNITPIWLLAAALVGAVIAIAFTQVINRKEAVPLSDIRLNILHTLIYPPGIDNKKDPAWALIVYSPANDHPIVGVSHNAELKFYDKIISRKEEDTEFKVVEARMLPPRREGNEVPPGQAPAFKVIDDSNITTDQWRQTLDGKGMIYAFVIAKYYGTENADKVRITELCRYITKNPTLLTSCDGHNRTYTEQ
jgi:hypothetical protein